LRVVKKAWKFTEWSKEEGKKKSPEPSFEALLDGATNKCFRITFGGDDSILNDHDVDQKKQKRLRRRSLSLSRRLIPVDEITSLGSDLWWKMETYWSLWSNAMMTKWRRGRNSKFDGKIEMEPQESNRMALAQGKGWKSSISSLLSFASLKGKGKSGCGEGRMEEMDGRGSSQRRQAFMRVQGAGSVLSNPREQEMAIFQYAAKEGLGARLYAVFENGYVAEYVKGRVVKVDEMRDEEMMKRIGKLVAKWHSLPCPSSVSCPRLFPIKGRKPFKTMSLHANTFTMIEKWLLRAKRLFSDEDALSLSNGLPPTFQAFSHELNIVKNDILPFYSLPHAVHVLCHNDLNHGNLLFFNPHEEKIGKDELNGNLQDFEISISSNSSNSNSNSIHSLYALDLEFSGINHRGFDLGNHFCEWAGLDLQYDTRLPSDSQIKLWLFFYLSHLNPAQSGFCHCPACYEKDEKCLSSTLGRFDLSLIHSPIHGFSLPPLSSSHSPSSPQSQNITSSLSSTSSKYHSSHSSSSSPLSHYSHITMTEVIEEMLVEVRKWMQVSHLFWWLWGMIQIKISNVEGFDAKNYCKVRWNEYMKHKEATLQLPHPPRLLSACPPFSSIFPSFSPEPSSLQNNLQRSSESDGEQSLESLSLDSNAISSHIHPQNTTHDSSSDTSTSEIDLPIEFAGSSAEPAKSSKRRVRAFSNIKSR
jgi:thiamine kinase-like enzyme